jgi:type VI secretion system secreted protein VgrG
MGTNGSLLANGRKTYNQKHRPMQVSTPLGQDALLLTGFSGWEAISQPFCYQLDLLAENQVVARNGTPAVPQDLPFDKLLGQMLTVELAVASGKRYFNGICKSLTQAQADETFTSYRMEMVPRFWLLTRRVQSRIFQHMTVPEILKKVLDGLDVDASGIQGSFCPRDYCVQYREPDFNFASRLMEEEGIYYFFKHSAAGHHLVLANTPQGHPFFAGRSEASMVIYEPRGGKRALPDRVYSWTKVQEIRSGKYTLWDHCFELPHQHLEAQRPIQPSVPVGKITHVLKLDGSDLLEIYDWPGGFAQRFDGVDRGGGDRSADLQKIWEDNQRTATIRMQEEMLPSLVIQGASNCGQLVAGYKFTLACHPNADAPYVVTRVNHEARYDGYRPGADKAFSYDNRFTAIPAGLPYRPLRTTARPVVQGTQTAVVVGPPEEEIFTDKYGRVKVQFHWDRQGKKDADSSCWIRVATPWAGQRWGMIHIPRVGQEVVIAFEEGDPDKPLIVGSVFNAEQMPPYQLPQHKTQSGVKSRSTLKGTPANFNEIRFEDRKGHEEILVHAERNLRTDVEVDENHHVGRNRKSFIDKDETTLIEGNRWESVKQDHHLEVTGGNREVIIAKGNDILKVSTGHNIVEVNAGDDCLVVKTGHRRVDVNTGHDLLNVKTGNQDVHVNAGNSTLEVKTGNRDVVVPAGFYQLHAKKVVIKAEQQVFIQVGSSSITIDPDAIKIKGDKVKLNSD